MKIALRLFCLTSLLCASWAVVGADDKQAKKTAPQTVLEALPRQAPKLNGAAAPAPSYAAPSAAVPAGSSIAVLSPPTVAQQPTVTKVVTPIPAAPLAPAATHTTIQLSHGTLQPTPEMWFYEQARQDYNNPELQSRIRGERYAAERRARLASRAWYGVSNSRPMANVTPFMYYYSPSWGSNTNQPFLWNGRTAGTAVVVEARRTIGVNGFGSW